MFRYDLRPLIFAAAVMLVTVGAANAQSQGPKTEKTGATAEQQARMHGLENELVELRRLVGKYQTELASILVNDLRASELLQLRTAEEKARTELTQTGERYQATRAELEVAVKNRIELQAQVARLAKRVEDEPAERAELRKQREQMTTQLVVLTEELKRERVRQDAEIESRRQTALVREEKLRHAMAENKRLEGRYLETTEALATLQQGFRLISSDAESARQQLRLVQERERQLDQQLTASRADQTRTVENKELLGALAAARNARREQTDEIVRLRGELRGVSQERDQLSSRFKAAEAEKTALRAREVENKRLVGQMRAQAEETVAVRQELNQLQEQKRQFEVALGSLRDRSGEHENLVTAFEESNAARIKQEQETGRLRSALASAVTVRKQLEATLEAAGETQANLQARQERVDAALAAVRSRLQQTLMETATTRQQLAAARKEAELALEQARLVKAQSEKDRSGLAGTLERLQASKAQATKDGKRLRLALKRNTQEKQKLAAALRARTAERDKAAQALGDVQAVLERNTKQIESLEAAMKTATGESAALAEELTTRVAATIELEGSLHLARDEAETLRQSQTAAEGQLSQLTARLAEIKEEKEAADQRLQVLVAEKQSVTKAITESYQQAVRELGPEIEQKAITVLEGPDRMTIRVGGTALFSPGQASLRPESRAMLDKVVEVLKEFPDHDVRAEGHTDSTGNWSSNWELSASRAGAVVRYLQEKGIRPERLASTGYGFYRPVASNDTPAGRAANRRIEITLEPKK